jgi:hypothetical protein
MIKEESVAENSEEWTTRDEEWITWEDHNRRSNIHLNKETLAVQKSWQAGSGPGWCPMPWIQHNSICSNKGLGRVFQDFTYSVSRSDIICTERQYCACAIVLFLNERTDDKNNILFDKSDVSCLFLTWFCCFCDQEHRWAIQMRVSVQQMACYQVTHGSQPCASYRLKGYTRVT